MEEEKRRLKEERLMKRLKDPDEKKDENRNICKLIDHVLSNKGKVYLSTDWHLWLRDVKDKPQCHKRSDFDTILNNMKNTITPDDLLIYMGDLVDGEFQNQESLKIVLQSFRFPMVLVRGNNDLFDKSFYKSCGFLYVTDAFTWGNIFFTHVPSKNDCSVNAHGHLHGYGRYYIPYTNQIDVAYLNGRKEPVDLMKVLRAQKAYAKTIKECPEHFNEQLYDNIFDQVNTVYIEDPFPDDLIGTWEE
jgi:calcineurin-like phosphoesterase family protein